MFYGIRGSHCHWYNKINAILQSFGLRPFHEDPCHYLGFIWDPSNPSSIPLTTPLTLGLYVNDFVSFSKDPAIKAFFCWLLAEHSKVDFMGVVEWFLGIHFLWRITLSSVLVHLNQLLGFASTVIECFFCKVTLPPLRLLHIALESPLTLLLPPRTMTPLQLRFVKKRDSKALLGVLAGLLAPLKRIFLPSICS
jgi:hypothetical protein